MRTKGDDGEFLLEPLLDVLCPRSCLPDTGRLLDDPLIRSRLVSADATTVGVYVAFDLPVRTKAVQTITAAVRALAADLKAETPGLEVQFAGGITMMSAFSEARGGCATLIPLVLVAVRADPDPRRGQARRFVAADRDLRFRVGDRPRRLARRRRQRGDLHRQC
jgi:hypothetical protein